MALARSVLVIEHESHAAVFIVVDAMRHSLRKLLGHERIRSEFLCLILVIDYRAELVCVVALGIAVL